MVSRVDRAKQFMPFDALSGLQLALREKEKEYIDKKELSDEMSINISNKLQMLQQNDLVSIVYYKNRQYITIQGRVEKIDNVRKYLEVNDTKIFYTNIYKLDIL